MKLTIPLLARGICRLRRRPPHGEHDLSAAEYVDVRVLWLIPHYYSFVVEELAALAPVVEFLGVLSQAKAQDIPGARGFTIPADRMTPLRLARRATGLVHAMTDYWPGPSADYHARLRRVARFREVIGALVHEYQIDVVHSHFAVPEGTGGTSRHRSPVTVLTLRGVDLFRRASIGYGFRLNRTYERNFRRTLSRVDAITVASKLAYDEAALVVPDLRKLHLVPNGVTVSDQGYSSVEARQRLGLPENGQIILAAGTLDNRKSYDVLLSAFASICRDVPDAKLVLVGDGPDRSSLVSLAAELKLGGKVIFAGEVERSEMWIYYSAATIFAHPSRLDAFGNVVSEAMSAGLPVVATNGCGAAIDLIEHEVSGLIVPAGDVDALGRAIGGLLRDPARVVSWGAAARARAKSAMTLERRAATFAEIYASCLGDGRRGVVAK